MHRLTCLQIILLCNLMLDEASGLDFAASKWTTTAGQWTPSEPNTIIVTFENQSAYLPCAMQSVNTFQQPSLQPDQLTLILWYYDDALHRPTNCLKNCSLNTNEPPIYSIDFRAPDDARSSRTTATSQPNAVHFISNGEFKGRILFELNVCHLSGSLPLRASSPSSRSPGQRTAHQPSNLYQINYYHQTNSSFSLPFIRPICAFLKLNQVKKSDAGRFSCRLDFRRSRTLHTSLLLKVLDQPKHFEIRLNQRRLANNSIVGDLSEGSSLVTDCSTQLIDKSDVYLKWHCDDQLSGFYSNEYPAQSEAGVLKARLRIKHLYRAFNERSCSCYLISASGQRLMHLQMFFQLHLAPVSVSIIKPSNVNQSSFNLFSVGTNRPGLLKNSRTLQLDAGQLLDLQCLASGSRPAANCQWSLLNGFQFKSKDYSESTSVESVSNDGGQLPVATVSTLSTLHLLATNQMDNQIVRCTCSNPLIRPLVQLIDQISLEVQSKPILRLTPYELKNSTKINKELLQIDNQFQTFKQQVREGDTVRLLCDVVRANPSLNGLVQWFINDIELEYFRRAYPSATVELEPGDQQQLSLLTIRNVNRETIGRFVCMAKNDKGEAQSNPVLLDVQYAPSCRPAQKLLYSLALGETVSVSCDLYADPLDTHLQFYWTLNGQPLPNSMFTTESIIHNDQSSLNAGQLTGWRPLASQSDAFRGDKNLARSVLKFNSSNYQFKQTTLACWASNTVGHQMEPCLFTLLATGPPEVPKNCSIHYEPDNEPEERQIEIGCEPGNDNALRQTLHLNVYRIKKAGGLTISVNSTNGRSAADPMMATLHNARIGSTTGVPDDDALSNTLDGQAINSLNPSDLLSDPVRSSPVHPTQQNRRRFIGQFNHLSTCGSPDSKRPASAVDLIVNQTVAINQTNQYIRFRRFKLSRVQPYLFIIFSSNSKGASEMLEFEWALDSGTATNEETTLNFLQIFVLTGYFFVGIFLAILLTYLLFTLALCFPFCLKLQLLIVNHRLLISSSSSKSREPRPPVPFSIERHSHNLANSGQLTVNKLSNSNRSISRSIDRSTGSADNRPNNVYNNLYECRPANSFYSGGNNHSTALMPFRADPNSLPLPGASFTLPNHRSSNKLTNPTADRLVGCSQPMNLNSSVNRINEQIYTELCKQAFVQQNLFGSNS